MGMASNSTFDELLTLSQKKKSENNATRALLTGAGMATQVLLRGISIISIIYHNGKTDWNYLSGEATRARWALERSFALVHLGHPFGRHHVSLDQKACQVYSRN